MLNISVVISDKFACESRVVLPVKLSLPPRVSPLPVRLLAGGGGSVWVWVVCVCVCVRAYVCVYVRASARASPEVHAQLACRLRIRTRPHLPLLQALPLLCRHHRHYHRLCSSGLYDAAAVAAHEEVRGQVKSVHEPVCHERFKHGAANLNCACARE